MSYIELGPTLRRLRKERGLRQGDVQMQLGLAENSLCHWETGKHEPKWASLCALADFYEISVAQLVSRAKRCKRK